MNMFRLRKIPLYFKPILWSYDFNKLDLIKNEKEIVLNTINYGELKHWFWIVKNYGKERVLKIVNESRKNELRASARNLVNVMFGSKDE